MRALLNCGDAAIARRGSANALVKHNNQHGMTRSACRYLRLAVRPQISRGNIVLWHQNSRWSRSGA